MNDEYNFIIGYHGYKGFDESAINRTYKRKGYDLAIILQNQTRQDLRKANYPEDFIDKFYFNYDPTISTNNGTFFFNISFPYDFITEEIGDSLNKYLNERVWELNENNFCNIKTPWGFSNFDKHYKNWKTKQDIDIY